MTAGNDFDPQPELFSALLTPHRSLNRTGFVVLMVFLSVVSFATGLAFLLMGAWPVFGFFGLDVLVIWWAFRINFRSARATEEIRITPSELRVRRVSHRGHVVEWVLNPLWVQLDHKSDAGIRHREALSGLARPPRLHRELPRTRRKSELCQGLIGSAAGRQARPDL